MNVRSTTSLLLLSVLGCAHSALDGSDLDRVRRPAFVSRVADGAGPQVRVYRDDSNRASQLQGTTAEDADRSLQERLTPTLSRFEAAERLRSHVHASIQGEPPWSQAVPPAQVAGALETFLVQEVPSTPPEYDKLKPLGADAVVEFTIEEYGLRTEAGVPQTWVRGRGRMFRLGDGGEIWRTRFDRTSAQVKLAPLDPAALGQDPQPFHEQMVALLDSVATTLAGELTPRGRAGGAPLPPGSQELRTPADAQTPLEKEIGKTKAVAPPPDATTPTEAPVEVGKKKKTPRPSVPPPDATTPTELPVDPNKH